MMEINCKTSRASVENRKKANEFKEILQGKMLGIILLKMISLNAYLSTEGRNCELLLIVAPKIPGATMTKHFH